ncbi:MAG: helix-turn-helix domain-containing protein [Pseudomonadota bacterium]
MSGDGQTFASAHFGVRSALSSPAAKRIAEAGQRYRASKGLPPEPSPAPVSRRRRALVTAETPVRETLVDRIFRESAEAYGVTVADIKGPSHREGIAGARHLAWVRLLTETYLTYKRIGDLSNRHPSTVRKSAIAYCERHDIPFPYNRTVVQ